jgi:GT2 family glycosyltransferase
VVLCEEPPRLHGVAHLRGLGSQVFNGTMASPADHPFWAKVIELCVRARHGADRDVLDSTGPLLLSAAVENWPRQQDFALHSCHLFAPDAQHDTPRFGDIKVTVSEHLWAGSWYTVKPSTKWNSYVGHARQWRHWLTRGRFISDTAMRASVDQAMLLAPLPGIEGAPNVALFIPVRNGSATLEDNFNQILRLSYPLDRIRIVYCEGDSTDDTVAIIHRLMDEHRHRFRGIDLIHLATGQTIGRHNRWKSKLQRKRRAAIAAVRNTLIRNGLKQDDEWVLWLDSDVVEFAPDTLGRLLAAGRKIVVPDCVQEFDGKSFDLNTFMALPGAPRRIRYKHMRGGLHQPPANYWYRRHLHDLRYMDAVEVDGVGGTMLLVHASVHRAGLMFPELPYRDLIETEAFGIAARALGVRALALPSVQIRHAPS